MLNFKTISFLFALATVFFNKIFAIGFEVETANLNAAKAFHSVDFACAIFYVASADCPKTIVMFATGKPFAIAGTEGISIPL